ncbi:RNA polymerase subunit sigma-24 [Streptomyces carminius]|uniref:RNA polymerase subunit sigma-24 n=1 Tax=Streptomyces carminius TaxID=2665496 RepID=A0A2M8MC28_9ACTN|nr:RNA polymerase sigma-70 factor [Streptomyces carminius]PJE97932.1 RNA polymerase subunit sigma-24 [Streptomyces carminius]PJF01759.1 RNA polymerase subunit sigma-24 [Streptomyces carminius]
MVRDGTGAGTGGSGDEDAAEVFEEHRPVLLSVAYRMLGRVADAEDVVQETWLRWYAADRPAVREPRAYLVRAATRLAVDRLRRIHARREAYVGPWLPEPLVTDYVRTVPDGTERVLLAESVSLAVLVVLESLSPLERTVFVLREAFGLPYGEIAGTLDRSEAAVRQLAVRARRHVAERVPRFDVDPAQRRKLTERFLAAALEGDLEGLLALLASDARLVGDGGGRAKAPLRTILGADKVARFTVAVIRTPVRDLEIVPLEVNGGPALLATAGGRPYAVLALETAGGLIHSVHLISNPDKLAHLAPPVRPVRPMP